MKSFRIISIIFSVILIFYVSQSYAQRLQCEVKIQMTQLQPRDQDDLSDLAQKLTDYVNKKNWSDQNQDIIIKSNIQLIIETVTTRGSEKVYKSQFLISSPSGENFYDTGCEFPYFMGQAFETYRTAFDPLLDLVDFYAYMVLAGELDTYELFSGTPFYNKAQDLANQGQLSNFSTGWTKRLEDIIQMTDGDHVPLREAKFYYYEGLYFCEREPNPNYARQFSSEVVKRLAMVHNKKPNSKALKRFLDSHFQEICSLFQFDRDRGNLDKMVEIDARHRDTYENCTPAF
jgi:hypothetical protein